MGIPASPTCSKQRYLSCSLLALMVLIKSKREHAFKFWEKFKAETRGFEDDAKKELTEDRRRIIEAKSFSLLQSMYCSSGGTDDSLLLDGLAGVPVTGEQGGLAEFPEKRNAASIYSRDGLRKVAQRCDGKKATQQS